MYRDHAVAVDEFAMFQPICFILWCMVMLSGKTNMYIVSKTRPSGYVARLHGKSVTVSLEGSLAVLRCLETTCNL